MKLISLSIRNFKGIKNETIVFDGVNTDIYGDNGTGKTTVYDAFLWLVADKDSAGRKQFSIKPLDKEGSPLQHGMATEVECTILRGKETISLKKVYKEKWEKRNGNKELSGHTTDCFFDSLPVSNREYNEKIENIIPIELFKTLSSATYFPMLSWQEQRKMLFDMFGVLDDAAIMKSNEKFKPLLETGKGVEDYKKSLARITKEINAELKEIPARIDELSMMSTDVVDVTELEAALAQLRDRRDSMTKQKSTISEDKAIMGLRQNISLIQTKLDTAKVQKDRHIAEVQQQGLKQFNESKEPMEKDVEELRRDIRRFNLTKGDLESQIEFTQSKLSAKRENWKKVNSEQWQGETTCPTCGQALPETNVKAAKEAFEKDKTRKLDAFNREGKEAKQGLEVLEEDLAGISAKIDGFKKEEASIQQKLNALVVPEAEIDPKYDKDIAYLTTYLDKLQKELEVYINAESDASIEKTLDEQIDQLNEQISQKENEIAQANIAQRNADRVAELEQKRRDLGKRLDETEGLIYLCEEFMRVKIAMLEDNINSHFNIVKFKLFRELINGSIEETCVATVDGVDYSDVNHAGKINAGLDIINAISKYTNFSVPLFIDNAESVISLEAVDAQLIRLVVVAGQKKLETIKQIERIA